MGAAYEQVKKSGFALGAFISFASASFAYEDPILRERTQAGMNNVQKTSQYFKDMGKGMWKSGKGFGKIGALYSGCECVVESVCKLLFPSSHIKS